MVGKYKTVLLLVLIFTFATVVKSDTKVIWEKSYNIGGIQTAILSHKISLENDKDVINQGHLKQWYTIPNDTQNVIKADYEFIGDKDGYRVKVTLKKEEFVAILRISPSTFKSLAG